MIIWAEDGVGAAIIGGPPLFLYFAGRIWYNVTRLCRLINVIIYKGKGRCS